MAKKKTTSKKTKTEKVCETFEITKNGKEKLVKSCGEIDIPEGTNKEKQESNKILRNFLIGIGIFILTFVLVSFLIYSSNNFEYKGLEFNKIKQGELTFYHTSFPVKYQGQVMPYNVYIRTNPKKLEEIPFEGNLTVMKNTVLNIEGDFKCDGKGIISIENLKQVFGAVGAKVITDENASCDPDQKYAYIKILEGEESKIVQTGPACYELVVNDCDILKVTERLIIEILFKVQKYYE